MKTADQIIAHSNVTEVSGAAAELYAHAKQLEAALAAAINFQAAYRAGDDNGQAINDHRLELALTTLDNNAK